MRTVKTLIRWGGCPDWYESLLGAQVILLGFVMLWLFLIFWNSLTFFEEEKKKIFTNQPTLLSGKGKQRYFQGWPRYCNAASIFQVEGCLGAIICSYIFFFYMTCILSILYHNLNALGPLHVNAEYSGINCLNISLGGWNLWMWPLDWYLY